DTLQGRATPSPGLDAAAEYIASQMRKAGLEPVGDDGYFQTATFHAFTQNEEGLTFSLGGVNTAESIEIVYGIPLHLTGAPAFKTTPAELDSLTTEQVKGKVLIVDLGAPAGAAGAPVNLLRAVTLEPSLIVVVGGARFPTATPVRTLLREVSAPPIKTAILSVWGSSM